jgi:hypothetical protein
VISPTDPAARYTASANSVAGYAYSNKYLIDLKHAVIMDVEATTTVPKRDGRTKDGTMLYFTRKQDCHACALKPQCCPNVPARKIARSIYRNRTVEHIAAHTGASYIPLHVSGIVSRVVNWTIFNWTSSSNSVFRNTSAMRLASA